MIKFLKPENENQYFGNLQCLSCYVSIYTFLETNSHLTVLFSKTPGQCLEFIDSEHFFFFNHRIHTLFFK